MGSRPDYSSWSNEQLIKRVTELEVQLKRQNASFQLPPPSATPASASPYKKPKTKKDRTFDPSKYSTRLIALKFAYLGQRYNGFEHHANNITPLPTIEEELWKALTKTKLIFPTRHAELKDGEIDWEGCDYSKCGRTDRGVSAFGQVIGIRVRSNRPLEKSEDAGNEEAKERDESKAEISENEKPPRRPFDHIKDELSYIQLLNRVLPEDIRMLAWCPSPPKDFSARFSCKERRYRYFFTQPAYAPVPGTKGLLTTADGKTMREGWLNIEAMKDAAKRYEGLHDFRNLCKVDPSKQITNFQRRIFHASITEVPRREGPVGFVGKSDFSEGGSDGSAANGDDSKVGDLGGPPRIYTFNVNGSAFLWHQVRHLVAVLFLVGQGLEPPSIVSDLLDMEKTPTRPKYEMATDAPLVLWDCIFPTEGDDSRENALEWIYIGENGGREANKRQDPDAGDGKFGRGGVMDDLWAVWRKRKIDEVLAGSLLDVVASQGRQSTDDMDMPPSHERSVRVYDGGNSARPVGKYVPVMQKARMESVDVINARYAERKGLDKNKSWSTQQADNADE
ncbi:hypothetical protein MBLNU459_g8519t3 [Dothideomycetes sp. NU459]